MRTIEQIEADIDFVRKDIAALHAMKAGTWQAEIDLLELKKELIHAMREEIKEENKDEKNPDIV